MAAKNQSYTVVLHSDSEALEQMAKELKSNGHQVKACSRERDFFRFIEGKPWHAKLELFIIPTVVDQVSGYDVTRRLRRMFPSKDTIIIMTSKSGSQDDVSEAQIAGASGCVTEPLKFEELNTVLEEIKLRQMKSKIGEDLFDINYH